MDQDGPRGRGAWASRRRRGTGSGRRWRGHLPGCERAASSRCASAVWPASRTSSRSTPRSPPRSGASGPRAVVCADHRAAYPLLSRDMADAWSRGMRGANRSVGRSAILLHPANETYNLQIERIVQCAGHERRRVFADPRELHRLARRRSDGGRARRPAGLSVGRRTLAAAFLAVRVQGRHDGGRRAFARRAPSERRAPSSGAPRRRPLRRLSCVARGLRYGHGDCVCRAACRPDSNPSGGAACVVNGSSVRWGSRFRRVAAAAAAPTRRRIRRATPRWRGRRPRGPTAPKRGPAPWTAARDRRTRRSPGTPR